jgi:signal transduction histidine kinase
MVNDLDKREFHRSVEEHYRMRSALYAPVKIGSRTIGVFAIYSDRRDCYTEPDLELLTAIGEHLGMVVTSAIMEDRARRIAVLEERNRHARDLHDGVHQVLASLKIYADEARAAMLAGDTDSAALILDQFGAMIDEAADELQGSIAALRQQHELLRDVYAVGGRLQRRLLAAGVGVDFRFDKLPLAPAVSDALAWICREATTNILKHSNARRVELQLTGDADTTVLTVRDDGVGISGPGRSADRDLHIGLEVMRERAEEVGGELTISTMDHGGVCVQCRVPTGGVGEPPAPT